MKFGQFMSYHERKKNYQKILQKLQPENFFKSACRPPQIHFLRGFFAN